MARTVSGPGGTITFSNPQYGMAMKLAYDSGWKPAGTLAPDNWENLPQSRTPEGGIRPWPPMNYFAGLGEQVLDEDAAALSDVLENVLDDIPNHDAVSHKLAVIINMPFSEHLAMLKPGEKLNFYEYFSGPHKQLLRDFIALCRAGGYTITGAGTRP